jgi:hypothetical protein
VGAARFTYRMDDSMRTALATHGVIVRHFWF